MRHFLRFHLIKVLLVLVVLQLFFFYWLQKRNHRPVANEDIVNVYEGHTVKVTPLRNDTDKDEEELKLHDVSKPLKGEITFDDKNIYYSISKGFTGVDSFQYTISDGKKISRKGYIKVNVKENLKPVAKSDLLITYPGMRIPIPVLGNDTDQERDTLSIREFTEPMFGKLEREGDILFYTANSHTAKTDSFYYIINDGYSNSDKATVKIIIKNKNDAMYPWLSLDVGRPSLQGSVVVKNRDMIIKGSGNDIWNDEDNFHYTYQLLSGDCEMITKIKSIENTNQWAKGGIMIRESLTGPSINAYMCLSKQNGVNCQIRFNTGAGTTAENQREDIEAPYWLKLVRKDTRLTGYRSPDGIQWTEVRTDSINLPQLAYIGLAVTSHNDEALCEVQFDMSKTVIRK